MTRECLDYGSKVVGGVTPGRGGRDVYGVPVYDTVAEAVDKHGVTGSVLTVPPAFTRDAVFEAIDNGIKLLVIVTERIPRFEVAEMVEFAKMHDARIIGPNCLGLITPEKCKMGGIGGPAADTRKAYKPGPVLPRQFHFRGNPLLPTASDISLGRDSPRASMTRPRQRPDQYKPNQSSTHGLRSTTTSFPSASASAINRAFSTGSSSPRLLSMINSGGFFPFPRRDLTRCSRLDSIVARLTCPAPMSESVQPAPDTR